MRRLVDGSPVDDSPLMDGKEQGHMRTTDLRRAARKTINRG
jgi:hypothetical protein